MGFREIRKSSGDFEGCKRLKIIYKKKSLCYNYNNRDLKRT